MGGPSHRRQSPTVWSTVSPHHIHCSGRRATVDHGQKRHPPSSPLPGRLHHLRAPSFTTMLPQPHSNLSLHRYALRREQMRGPIPSPNIPRSIWKYASQQTNFNASYPNGMVAGLAQKESCCPPHRISSARLQGSTPGPRLITRSTAVKHLDHYIRLDVADVRWWSLFASHWNGTSLLTRFDKANPQLSVTADASGKWGCGACKWIQFEWPTTMAASHISIREMIPIVMAAALWGRDWSEKSMRFWSVRRVKQRWLLDASHALLGIPYELCSVSRPYKRGR